MGRSNGHFIHVDLEKRVGVLLSFFVAINLKLLHFFFLENC